MDFDLTDDQRAIVEAADKLLRRVAGPKRARQLAESRGYDAELARALAEAGFTDVARASGGESGALEATLVAEAVARHAGLVDYGAQALVAPAVTNERLEAPIAIARADRAGPVRYGAQARTLLVLDRDAVRVRRLQPGDAHAEPSNFGFPIARVPRDGGDVLTGAGPRLRAAWDVALAAEISGTLRAALELTVEHVKTRQQFGKPLGAFQALQHRLAECAVLSEGARWLALEAASRKDDADRAGLAAAHASVAAQRIFHESHQLHGAMGLTREHDLFLWSMRLPALWLEARA
jgi:alkylation response protein AidB-like acyl-CoA dehydrogenase